MFCTHSAWNCSSAQATAGHFGGALQLFALRALMASTWLLLTAFLQPHWPPQQLLATSQMMTQSEAVVQAAAATGS